MSMVASPIYTEVYEFLLSSPTPEQVIAFRASTAIQERAYQLLEANRGGTLTAEQEAELNEFERVNHFVSMLKIYARQRLRDIP